MNHSPFVKWPLCVAVLLMLLAAQARAAQWDGDWTLVLKDAVVKHRIASLDAPTLQPLRLEVSRHEDKFGPVWGYAETLNRGDHRGRVVQSAADGDALRLKAVLKIAGDPWIAGGRAEYDITVRRQADGTLAGTFEGSFWGVGGERRVAGAVSGELVPAANKVVPDFVPLQPGEHPRLLFRASELPALRAKLQTPAGRQFYDAVKAGAEQDTAKAKEGDLQAAAVCSAVMYQLTGEKRYAERARAIIGEVSPASGLLKTGYHNGANNLPEPWGWNIATVAITWDLCYDAWDDAYRQQVREHMTWMSERLLMRPHTVSSKMNWAPGSNYQPGTRGGASLAAFALCGEKGPPPARPADPGERPALIQAPEGYRAHDSVPVVDHDPNAMAQRWLYVGPFTLRPGQDALADIGGRALPQMKEGAEVSFGQQTSKVRALDPAAHLFRHDKHTADRNALDISALAGRQWNTTIYLLTQVRSEKRRTVALQVNFEQAKVYVGGVAVRPGQLFDLPAGTVPVALEVQVGQTEEWGKLWTEPRLMDVPADVVDAHMAKLQREYRWALDDWKADMAEYEANGGMDLRLVRVKEIAELHMRRYFASMMGEGGYQAEGEAYTVWSVPLALQSAHAYRTAFGRNPGTRDEVAMFGPRYVAQTVFGHRGTASQSFGAGDYNTISAGHYARLFRLVPDSMQPGVLWAWNRTLGVAPGDQDAEGIRPAGGLDAVYGLLNYPVDMKAKNPAEGGIPRVFVSRGRGNYIFRNQWQDDDDIVAQVHLRSMPPAGWNQPNAGSIRLRGLGHNWAVSQLQPKNGDRTFENVVLLPEDATNVEFGAFRQHFDAKADGSGSLTIDMNGLYSGVKTTEQPVLGKDGKPTGEMQRIALLQHFNNQWSKEGLADLGIRGTRSFAVDYSGMSGSPALLAIVDEIQGGKTKIWSWQVPDKAEVKIDGNTFTIKQGDATLRATFVAPVNVQISHASGTVTRRVVLSSVRMTYGDKKLKMNAIEAAGQDKTDGGFFVVMTLQRGDAPAVRISGTGLSATATVGKQVVSYKDRKLTIGSAP